MSRPHGADLVAILGSLLTQAAGLAHGRVVHSGLLRWSFPSLWLAPCPWSPSTPAQHQTGVGFRLTFSQGVLGY